MDERFLRYAPRGGPCFNVRVVRGSPASVFPGIHTVLHGCKLLTFTAGHIRTTYGQLVPMMTVCASGAARQSGQFQVSLRALLTSHALLACSMKTLLRPCCRRPIRLTVYTWRGGVQNDSGMELRPGRHLTRGSKAQFHLKSITRVGS